MKAGEKHNKLTAIRFIEKRNYRSYWLFQCDCGNQKVICGSNVTNGHIKSCGCLASAQSAINGRTRLKDLTGKRFGKLTALSYSEEEKAWLCKCDCGNIKYVTQANLCRKKGSTISCGCELSLDAANSINQVENTNVGSIINNTAHYDSRTGVRGVYYIASTKLYTSTISFQKKRYYLGSSKDFEKMVAIRKAAEQQIYGDFIEWYNTNYKQNLKKH